MMISLPPELEAFAHRQVENGKYGSIEALLAAGVRALIDREDIYEGRLKELQREAQIGIDSLERGEKLDLDTAMESLRLKMCHHYGQLM